MELAKAIAEEEAFEEEERAAGSGSAPVHSAPSDTRETEPDRTAAPQEDAASSQRTEGGDEPEGDSSPPPQGSDDGTTGQGARPKTTQDKDDSREALPAPRAAESQTGPAREEDALRGCHRYPGPGRHALQGPREAADDYGPRWSTDTPRVVRTTRAPTLSFIPEPAQRTLASIAVGPETGADSPEKTGSPAEAPTADRPKVPQGPPTRGLEPQRGYAAPSPWKPSPAEDPQDKDGYVIADEEVGFKTPAAFRRPAHEEHLVATVPLTQPGTAPRRDVSDAKAVARAPWETPAVHVDRACPRRPTTDAPPAREPADSHWSVEQTSLTPSAEGHNEEARGNARARELPRRRLEGLDYPPALENHLAELIGVLRAPTVNLPTFDGNPLEYPTFIRAFDENVEKTLRDNGAKLARLTQLCVGDAARALRCCAYMDADQGYHRARELLREWFGHPYDITELWVEKMTEGGTRTNIREYADDLRNCYESLNALGSLAELQTQGSLAMLVRKLPDFMRNRWRDLVYEMRTAKSRRPTLLDVVQFVERQANSAADPVYGSTHAPRASRTEGTRQARSERAAPRTFAATAEDKCPACQEVGHEVAGCNTFARLRPDERLSTALRLRLCFVCLRAGHITRDCTDKQRCQALDCGRLHATLLHEADWEKFRENGRRRGNESQGPPETRPAGGAGSHAASGGTPAEGTGNHAASSFHVRGVKVALPILPVQVTSPETGQTVQTYALLDSGSNVTLCQDKLLDSLGVTGRREAFTLMTLEKAHSTTETRVASLTVSNLEGDDPIPLQRVHGRKDLNLDQASLVTEEEVSKWPHLRGLPLLHHAEISDVTLLIGQDCLDAVAPLSSVRGERGDPYATRTRLGWTISGPMSGQRRNTTPTAMYMRAEGLAQLQGKVDRFWSLDSSGIFDAEKAMSTQDKAVLGRWEKEATVQAGHYSLPIPFREEHPNLPDNRQMAERRLASLARKLQRDAGGLGRSTRTACRTSSRKDTRCLFPRTSSTGTTARFGTCRITRSSTHTRRSRESSSTALPYTEGPP